MNQKLKDGLLLWWSVLLYNALRFFVEFYKDSSTFLGLGTGHYLCLAFSAVAIYFIVKIKNS